MRPYRLSLLIAIALCTPLAAEPLNDADLSARIDALAAKALEAPPAVGLSIAVARDGRVVLARGYGKADLEFDIPVNDLTMFRIGSITKQFTAAAIMRLVEQGKLTLDDTLDKLLPDFPPTKEPVTLRHLLTHTSGLWSYTEDATFMTRTSRMELLPREVIDVFKDHAPDFPPGTDWNYSNSGYYLLGEIIGRASGKSYERFVAEDLAQPLALDRTRYESNTEIIPNRAQGYTMFNGRRVNDQAIGAHAAGAAGALLSTAGDLVRWASALASGAVVAPESYAAMTTPAVLTSGKRTEYGFGLIVSHFESRPIVTHDGGIAGFTSHLSYFPEERVAVAVLSNSEAFSPTKLGVSIAKAALGIAEFTPADLPLTEADAARFLGDFKFDTIPLEITFRYKDGHLWGQATNQPSNRMLYQGRGEFRAEFDPQVKIIFNEGEGPVPGFTLFQGGELTATRK